MTHHELTFTSTKQSMHLVEELIDKVCSECKISGAHYGNIYVAITEAVYNAMNHGNKLNPSKKINIIFNGTDTTLNFTIKDEGAGFNYTNLPDPTSPENIEKESGRGIFLIKQLSNKVEFLNGGNTISITFKRN